MIHVMRAFTYLLPADKGIKFELVSHQRCERQSQKCTCSFQTRSGVRALETFHSMEQLHNCHHLCGNPLRRVHIADLSIMRNFWRHEPVVSRTVGMNGSCSEGNRGIREHWQVGAPSALSNLMNGFLGDCVKQLQSATAGGFNLWTFVPAKAEFLDLSRELTGTTFVWEGWGTSLCWWANFVGGLPESDMNFVLDLLFDQQKGLGLTIARYNIGGGADLSVDTNLRPFAAIPGFLSSADGKYDWSADERQRNVLLGAKARGVDTFEAFSNSPPRWMTLSGSVTGNYKRGQDNLDVQHYEAFADYLTEVVLHYKNEWNVNFDYLAPFNEPVEGFWNINRKKPAQEGCNFSIAAINKIICKLKESLAQKGLSTEISGVDSWSFNTARVLRGLDEATIQNISRVNVHTYIPFVQREGDAKRTEVRRIVGGLKKKLWMSEYGPLHWRGSELDVALAVARHISLDINELQASAWCYWQVLEVPGKNFYWGLLHAEFEYNLSFSVELKKQYYIMMHFSRWIRPGFVIYPVEGNRGNSLVIAVDPSSYATLVIVLTSTSDIFRDISFDASAVAHNLREGQIQAALVRTSATENHEQLPTLRFESPILTVRIAPKSITTVIVSRV
ncbi:hypothetical protein R1sor_008809 [Riccia sorocarpa]|uniref:Endo-beta-1,6-galactanase-like domain-containing protein n=1 Tax=Riccia sorocarpa TaxID=122646 RepID=A0ABD3HUN3_9MARC